MAERAAVRWRSAVQAIPWAELVAGGALLLAWTLLTWGIASLLVWQVWPISSGLLLLSLLGWRWLRTIATVGLYALSREGEPRP